MLQRQTNPLNRSRTPERREQVTPGPVRAASGIQIDFLGGDVDALGGRADTLETRMAFAEADIDALQLLIGRVEALEALTADQADVIAAHTVTIGDHEARIATLEAEVAAHDARITVLEP